MKKGIARFFGKLIEILIYKQKQIEIFNVRLMPNTFIDKYFYVGAGTYFNLNKGFKELTIEENVVARKSCNFTMYPNAMLIIRQNVFFNNYCSINCLGKIEIGANTLLGEGVKIYDHNHAHNRGGDGSLNVSRDEFTIGEVIIGANCWIGSNVTILKNVHIGDNVIIGANCLIFNDVASNSIVKLNNDLVITGPSASTQTPQ